jgi:cytochrome c oxidase subunit IV
MDRTGPARRPGETALSPTRTYLAAWAALLVFLGLTIAVARAHIAPFGAAANLLIATIKSAIVLAVFMHLRSEGKFLKIMLGVALGALTLIIMLTFSDVLFRR